MKEAWVVLATAPKKQVKKFTFIFSGAACFFCFCIGLVFTTGAGEYWLTLFDNYGAMGLTMIGLAEIMAVMYVYGHKKFTQDIEDMTGVRPGILAQFHLLCLLKFFLLFKNIVFAFVNRDLIVSIFNCVLYVFFVSN